MTRRLLPLATALLALALVAVPASAGDVHQKLLEQHQDSVVSVKIVLALQISARGQTMDQEITTTATGILVDPAGLVMMDSNSMSPRGPRGVEIKASPTSIRVVFPGDPKEYEAVLGATDSRIGLSFARIKDLEGKAVKAVDLTGEPEVAVGDDLYGVTRLGQGFDYAPMVQTATITGWVKKPRKMWAVHGPAVDVAHPLLTADGKVVAFVIRQEAVGSNQVRAFALPLKVVRSTIERAGKEAEKVLEEALEAEAEAEAEAAEAEAEGETEEATEEEAPEEIPEEEAPAAE